MQGAKKMEVGSDPFPFRRLQEMWGVISNPKLFKGPEISAEEGRAPIAEYKRQHEDYKSKGGTRSFES